MTTSTVRAILCEIRNNTLEDVNIFNEEVGIRGANAIAAALKRNTSVKCLTLTNTQTGTKGIIALAEAIEKNTNINKVRLMHSNITQEGVVALAKAFKNNASITEVSLNGNHIGNIGVATLTEALKEKTSLKKIGLSGNDITRVGAKALAEVLSKNNSITDLELYDNPLGDAGISEIVDGLKNNNTIEELELDNSFIRDNGAERLAGFIGRSRSLRTINMGDNEIGDDGAIALANALKVNRSLSSLRLENNKIKSNGALAIAKAIENNHGITKINLKQNQEIDRHLETGQGDDTVHAAEALVQATRNNKSIVKLSIDKFYIDLFLFHDINIAVKSNKSRLDMLITTLSNKSNICSVRDKGEPFVLTHDLSLKFYKEYSICKAAVYDKVFSMVGYNKEKADDVMKVLDDYWEVNALKISSGTRNFEHKLPSVAQLPREILYNIGSYLKPGDVSLPHREMDKLGEQICQAAKAAEHDRLEKLFRDPEIRYLDSQWCEQAKQIAAAGRNQDLVESIKRIIDANLPKTNNKKTSI